MVLNQRNSKLPDSISLLETATSENNALLLKIVREAGIRSVDDLNVLEENSIAKLGNQSKLCGFASKSAMIIAREKDDPLYKQMAYHRRAFLRCKEAIRQKYSNRTIQRAKIAMTDGSVAAIDVNVEI